MNFSRHRINRDRLLALLDGVDLTLPIKGGSVELVAERFTPAELLDLVAGRGLVESGELQFERGEFATRRGSQVKTGGVVARCDCGAKFWRVFQLDGDSHFHIECASCGVSYCPGGKCE